MAHAAGLNIGSHVPAIQRAPKLASKVLQVECL